MNAVIAISKLPHIESWALNTKCTGVMTDKDIHEDLDDLKKQGIITHWEMDMTKIKLFRD